MANKDINDEEQWGTFVDKLTAETRNGRIAWKEGVTERDDANGPVFLAEILKQKYVVAYRYEYTQCLDEDRFDTQEDVAIELAGEDGERLWRLPEVYARHALMDVVEYKNARADAILEAFLSGDANEKA